MNRFILRKIFSFEKNTSSQELLPFLIKTIYIVLTTLYISLPTPLYKKKTVEKKYTVRWKQFFKKRPNIPKKYFMSFFEGQKSTIPSFEKEFF